MCLVLINNKQHWPFCWYGHQEELVEPFQVQVLVNPTELLGSEEHSGGALSCILFGFLPRKDLKINTGGRLLPEAVAQARMVTFSCCPLDMRGKCFMHFMNLFIASNLNPLLLR